jgi:hypothetical protein
MSGLLELLGVEGEFVNSPFGNNQIIGAPDFSWLRNNVRHPLLVVRLSELDIDHPHFMVQAEYKTKLAAPPADLGISTNQIRASRRDSQSMLFTKYMAT